MKVKHADAIIRLGMGTDKWIDELIHVARNPTLSWKTRHVDASTHIKALEIPTGPVDGRDGDIHAQGNPHYWLNPNNGKVIAQQIKDHLSQLDPSNAAIYERNYLSFCDTIDRRMPDWQQSMNAIQDRPFFTYHKVWSYFFDAFNLRDVAQLEPVPGIPPTAKHLLAVKKIASSEDLKPIVLSSNFYPKHVSQTFADDIDASFYYLSSNVSDEGIDTYIELFDYLVQELTQ